MVPGDAVLRVLQQLSHDIRDLDVGSSVDRHHKLSALQFLRDYVGPNKPVVLTGATAHWPACTKWSDDAYICSVAGEAQVTVALTPNGRADAVVTPLPGPSSSGGEGEGAEEAGAQDDQQQQQQQQPAAECFALPHQVRMPLRDFLALLRSSRDQQQRQQQQQQRQQQQQGGVCGAAGPVPADPAGSSAVAGVVTLPDGTTLPAGVVPYLQYQNSSLTAELPQLLADVEACPSWAAEAFGGPPEAVNLWIGDGRSLTSWHKDPFENIYAVVAGSKTFSLLPPTDIYRMRLRRYPQATYRPAGGSGCNSGGGSDDAGSSTAQLHPALHSPAGEVLWSSVPPIPATLTSTAAPAAARAPAPAPAAQADLFASPSLPPPLRVTVQAGETLYLPAHWWHQVEQEPDACGRAIAVNYWFDCKWDARYAHLQAVERLAQLLGLNEAPPAPPTSDFT